MRLGVIADDFTGATDIAGLMARAGASVRLHTGLPRGTMADASPVEAEVIALKIRTCPVAEAVDQARQAARWLREAGAERLFWKYCSTFDSTAEGNIGPVAQALIEALGTDLTVHAPSFPENGRTVYQGQMFVLGVPLAESPMKDHPLTPMRDNDLRRVLAPQVPGRVGGIDWHRVQQGPQAVAEAVAEARTGGVSHLVLDALTGGDLQVLAEATAHLPLVCGGSAFGAAVLGPAARATQPLPALPAGPALILSGSCSAATRAQVAAFRATGAAVLELDPRSLDRDGPGAALDWLHRHLGAAPILVTSSAEPDALRAVQRDLGTERASDVTEAAMAEIARAARRAGATRIVVAGGETSGAVTQALQVDSLRIGREIAPGVPWCFGQDSGGVFALALKSGNFGGPAFFAQALDALPHG